MKDFINNVFSNIVSGYIVVLIGSVGSAIIGFINPITMPYIIIVSVLLLAFALILFIYSFGTARFKWSHIHSVDTQCLTLKSDGTATDSEKISTVSQSGFEGIVTGEYFGEDVAINRFELKSQNAEVKATLKYKDGREEEILKKNDIKISGDVIEVNYAISFANNAPEDVTIDTSMRYDVKSMKPEYFVDVFRPIRKLVIELRVQNTVKIRNIRKEIWPAHGDDMKPYKRGLHGRKCKEDASMTVYRYTVIYPQLLHSYKICWDWIV